MYIIRPSDYHFYIILLAATITNKTGVAQMIRKYMIFTISAINKCFEIFSFGAKRSPNGKRASRYMSIPRTLKRVILLYSSL